MKHVLLQGVTTDNHFDSVNSVLDVPELERVIISVAYMNYGGISLLEDKLAPIADNVNIFVGIRNGITSAQALNKCLSIGYDTHVVDTGSRFIVFHPKIYLARGGNEARLLVGSANLTRGGLNGNIEASMYMQLDLREPENSAAVSDLEAKLDTLVTQYVENVFKIDDQSKIDDLLKSGRVTDERVVKGPTTTGYAESSDLDITPKIELQTRSLPRSNVPSIANVVDQSGSTSGVADLRAGIPNEHQLEMVWRSNRIVARDLNVPSGSNTNVTGSMMFKKGSFEDIDQRHYFRDEVFDGLQWSNDPQPRRQHIERATARVWLVIRGVNHGGFTLRLSHNTDITSRTYQQRNGMTHLHWGNARSIVAREDLLNRTMTLFRDELHPDQFVLEID